MDWVKRFFKNKYNKNMLG